MDKVPVIFYDTVYISQFNALRRLSSVTADTTTGCHVESCVLHGLSVRQCATLDPASHRLVFEIILYLSLIHI